jgi:DNA (cytosine-5)-methyltransferase 1
MAKALTYLSVCSGIEAATVAWHPLGWNPVGFGEIEKFPSQVLAHHYPNVPNLGDMTKFKEWQIESDVNVLVGGTPCQSFSVAGLRKGLDDPRGNLMLTYLAIAAKYRPKWLVWENVPGVLSTNGGHDFASLLRGMGELGYGFAYRVLDAQYFGVAQRRRRVFAVGYLGNWQRAAAVLFERHSLCGYPAPNREKGKSVAPTIKASVGTGGVDVEHPMIAVQTWPAEVSSTLDTTFGAKMGLENQHVNAGCPMFVPATYDMKQHHNPQPSNTVQLTTLNCAFTRGDTPLVQPIALAENTIGRKPENGGNGDGYTEGGPMYTLNATGVHGVVQPMVLMDQGGSVMNVEHNIVGTLRRETHGHEPIVMQAMAFDGYNQTLSTTSQTIRADKSDGDHVGMVMHSMAVRRLTPTECERLQGFPDGYTDIKHNGKPTPDGPRYKALGNSMAVPVMAWIGKRIQEVDAING